MQFRSREDRHLAEKLVQTCYFIRFIGLKPGVLPYAHKEMRMKETHSGTAGASKANVALLAEIRRRAAGGCGQRTAVWASATIAPCYRRAGARSWP
jgi:hypothetical protein